MEQGISIWQADTPAHGHPELTERIRCDAAVIGGGLAGILTAKLLSREGADCVVLERDGVGCGETGRTTAKITAQHELIYQRITKDRGADMARLYAAAQTEAIGAYARFISTLDTDCGFTWCPAYLYTVGDDRRLKAEREAAAGAGLDMQLTANTELPLPVTTALRLDGQARFRPLEFLRQAARGLTIYEHSPVRDIRYRDGETVLVTPGGAVTARTVVFACHYPIVNVPGWYFLRQHQERSYVLALENVPAMEGMYLGIDERGLSFRPEGQYLLLGGGGHRTGEDSGRPYEILLSRAKAMWPECRAAERWSAQDCMSVDGVPFIGRYARSRPEWYVATGFGKWGMTNSMVSARLITDLICGRESPYTQLFDPARSLTHASAALANEAGHAAKGLTKGLLKGRRCAHMGCHLEWNAAEGTWDCPCHGSRYTADGILLENPATEDLHIE